MTSSNPKQHVSPSPTVLRQAQNSRNHRYSHRHQRHSPRRPSSQKPGTAKTNRRSLEANKHTTAISRAVLLHLSHHHDGARLYGHQAHPLLILGNAGKRGENSGNNFNNALEKHSGAC
jgi:hypothetical protein